MFLVKKMIYDQQLAAKKELIQVAETVLQERQQILIHSATEDIIEMFEKISFGFEENLKYLENLSYDYIKFLVSLIINGTQCFEAFSLYQDGRRRFQYTEKIMKDIFQQNTSSIIKAMLDEIIIYPFTKQYLIDQAVQNVKQNYMIAKLIAGQEFTLQKLNGFLSIQEYKVFECQKCEQFIKGLSSFDGRTVYIYVAYTDRYKKRKVQPDSEIERITQFSFNETYIEVIWLIEYQLMENLSRWSSQSNILSISPERNENLRIDNQMVGSGNLYLIKAYQLERKQQNPFQLNYMIWNAYIF